MKKNPYQGKFIVFEGLDGSGQTTQVKLLENYLEGKGYRVVSTKEPTQESEAGKEIKEILNHKKRISASRLQELFAQDRREHLEGFIIPALKEGKIVISDRYFFSSFAYGSSEGLELNWLLELNKDFILPDITFILKVKPEVCIERIEKRGEAKTLFEKQEKLREVWNVYKTFAEGFENVYIINGEKPKEKVFFQVKKIIFSNKINN
ncbi:MAG TPA: dTMP kinase [Candidatus Parcubacteria bacterium]|nr:dTMP kinase [Candidatus Parcubacteria bacterium]